MRKNIAGQRFFFSAFQPDGTPVTASVVGTVAKDGAANGAITGTLTHLADGKWRCDPSQADTNGDYLGFSFTGGSMVTVVASFDTVWHESIAATQTSTSQLSYTGGNVDSNVITFDAAALASMGKALWDYLTSAVTLAGSMGKLIVDNLNATITSRQPSGAVDLNADQSGVTIGTCTTNTDMRGTDNALLAASAPANFGDLAITVTTGMVTVGTNNDKADYKLDPTERNPIADHVLRRNSASARASSDGDTVVFRSLLGAASKLHNKVGVVSTNLLIREEDDATVFGTQAVTTSASAEPIVDVDTT